MPDKTAHTFWSSNAVDLTLDDWAIAWWQAAWSRPNTSQISAPSEMHEPLARQFVRNPTFGARVPQHFESLLAESSWAIWHLSALNSALCLSFEPRSYNAQSFKKIQEICELSCASELNYDGLNEHTAKAVQMLLRICCDCITCLAMNQNVVDDDEDFEFSSTEPDELVFVDLEDHQKNSSSVSAVRFTHLHETVMEQVSTLQNLLDEPGYIGWMAARVGLTLLRVSFFNRRGSHSYLVSEEEGILVKAVNGWPECATLWQSLKPFYDPSWQVKESDEPDQNEEGALRTLLMEARHGVAFYDQPPLRIRLVPGEMQAVVDIFRAKALGEKDCQTQLDEMHFLPFRATQVEEFLNVDTTDLKTGMQLLRFLERQAQQVGYRVGYQDGP